VFSKLCFDANYLPVLCHTIPVSDITEGVKEMCGRQNVLIRRSRGGGHVKCSEKGPNILCILSRVTKAKVLPNHPPDSAYSGRGLCTYMMAFTLLAHSSCFHSSRDGFSKTLENQGWHNSCVAVDLFSTT
jgi:hypothetical protein